MIFIGIEKKLVEFEVLTAIGMDVAIFWDIVTCYMLGCCSSDFSAQKTEVIRSSETLTHLWTTWHYFPEDGNISRNFISGFWAPFTKATIVATKFVVHY
jgi:hypothetical protein